MRSPKEMKDAYSEALAYSFGGYAREVYNTLELDTESGDIQIFEPFRRLRGIQTLGLFLKFGDTQTPESRKNYIDEMIRMPGRIYTHGHALSIIRTRLNGNCKTYEEVYKTLKAPLKKIKLK